MLNGILSWTGGGLILIIIYFLISNTLWLLFGSKILQYLPGINNRSSVGTFKIAAMIALAAIGTLVWILKYILSSIIGEKAKPCFKNELSKMIQRGAKVFQTTPD
jgi:hypothetical protein